MSRQALLVGVIGCWGIGVVVGFVVLMDYQNGPGPLADAPSEWPGAVASLGPGEQPVLLVFAHPRCPCTEATMGELARLMRHVQRRMQAHVFFTQPAEFETDWVRSALWRQAEAIPGVTPHRDPEARRARQFGAYTSGQVMLYDADRHLVFNGGITGSRGHEGNNKGRQAITEWIETGRTERTSTFVFGCLLRTDPDIRAVPTASSKTGSAIRTP